MVISELLRDITQKLRESGNDNPLFEANQLIGYAFNMSTADIALNRGQTVSDAKAAEILSLVKRRTDGEPLQYILGTQEFMSLSFIVGPDVLIPRQDTEILVELILDMKISSPVHILDIGTGTGCIPISLMHFNKNITATGIDISEGALKTARKNAEISNVSDRFTLLKTDIMTEIPDGKYDIVVSNPPYIKSGIIPSLQREVKDFEPISALDGGADGLAFYRRICEISGKLLNPHGFAVFEIGYDQAKSVSEIMSVFFEEIKITKDLCGNDRVISGYLK